MEAKLVMTGSGLTLTDGEMELRGDFTKMSKRIKQGVIGSEMLVKASKIKNADGELTCIDATAGLGEDSILLAAAGFKVIMCEKDEVICALLRDALERAKEEPGLRTVVSRMSVYEGDSIEYLSNCDIKPDVVFLDPMFPERQKSALVKKKFQLLHQLESPCNNEEELLEAAIKAGPKKIVIKRPAKGEYLAGRKPDYSLDGKAIRYDCFVFAQN